MLDTYTWIPASDPIGRLAQLPALVAELSALGQSRNPDGESTHTRHVPGSRPPLDVSRLDILPTPGWEPPMLRTLADEASRVIWEAIDTDTRAAHPQPRGLTWATECAWLADVWPDACAVCDMAALDMARDAVDQTYRNIADLIGLRPPTQLRCPDCGAGMETVEGGAVLVCRATAWQAHPHEYPGPARVEGLWRRQPAAPAPELAGRLGLPVTSARLRQWVRRGRIRPASKAPGRPSTFFPWDVVRCLWPAIVEAIDERHSCEPTRDDDCAKV